MKSLNEHYSSNHGSSQETFSDLMFCALIVLVLFIMALTIEVSNRVRADRVPEVAKVIEVDQKELSTMTKEEVAELSQKLQRQQHEMTQLREKLKDSAARITSQKNQVSNKLAAFQGEQRFTGAREPASLSMAYDYSKGGFHFISSRESNHATRHNSGETNSQFRLRQTKEFVAIALKTRKQRSYSKSDAIAIYKAFSTYKEVEPSLKSYRIVDSVVGISYVTTLSGYVAGDTDISETMSDLVVKQLLDVYEEPGPKSDRMYPSVTLKVDLENKKIRINGIMLSPQDTKEILLSVSGRGAMVDLEGLEGKPPRWLTEEVLIPAGYISKTPKIPSN